MDFSSRIKSRRLELGFSMQELASAVGVSHSTVSRWESGDIESMKQNKIKALADALRVSPSYLLGWTDEQEPTPALEWDEVTAGLTMDEKKEVLNYIMFLKLQKKLKNNEGKNARD